MTDTEVTDTITVGNTEGRHWTWHAPLVEDVLTFGTLPDPRDALIAKLEATLRNIRDVALAEDVTPDDALLFWIGRKANIALMYPESDMSITVEELEA